MRKNKVDRDQNRDISEKIALGMLKGTGKLQGDSIYDSRLFNQTSGMDSGFGGDDEYNTYSKPLFDRGEAVSIYRPRRADGDVYGDADAEYKKLTDTSKFRPDKGFMGAEARSGDTAGGRSAPVQFEKEGTSSRTAGDDPFGIGDLVGTGSKHRSGGGRDDAIDDGRGKRQRRDED
jgi:SNW domain-containing protein 1